MLYAVVAGWTEVASTGGYGEVPFLVDLWPGIAINIAVASFVFCILRHGKQEKDVEHRWMMVCLLILMSGVAFLAMAAMSWVVYEDARTTAEMIVEMEALMEKAKAVTKIVSE